MAFVEKYKSIELIAKVHDAYNHGELSKGLRWLASREPCKGCRYGGGWSWWPDCPARECIIEKELDFCHQCEDFPCNRLREEPLLSEKNWMIEANNQMRDMDMKDWVKVIRKKYEWEQRDT